MPIGRAATGRRRNETNEVDVTLFMLSVLYLDGTLLSSSLWSRARFILDEPLSINL